MQDVISRAKELIADGQIEPALQLLQEYVESDEHPAGNRAAAWRLISNTSRDLLDLDRARHALAQAISLYQESGEEELELETRLYSAYDDLNNDRFMEAQHTCTLILNRAEEQNWTKVLAMAYEVKASINLHRYLYQEALDDCQTAIKLFTDVGELDRIDRIALSVARAYTCMGRFDLAKPYYEKSVAFFKRKGGLNSSLISRVNIGLAAYMAREYDTAEGIYNEILEDIKDLDRGFITSIVRQCLGMLQLTQGEFRSARKNLLISLQNVEQGEHRRLRVADLTALAIVSVMLDEPGEALSYASLSRDNCVEYDDVESRLIIYYLAIIHLANDSHELAESFWNVKLEMDWSVEMGLEYDWMVGMLRHIQAEDYQNVLPLCERTLNLAAAWFEEIEDISRKERGSVD